MRWLGHLNSIPPGRLPVEEFRGVYHTNDPSRLTHLWLSFIYFYSMFPFQETVGVCIVCLQTSCALRMRHTAYFFLALMTYIHSTYSLSSRMSVLFFPLPCVCVLFMLSLILCLDTMSLSVAVTHLQMLQTCASALMSCCLIDVFW